MDRLTTLDRLRDAAAAVHEVMPPTPQYCWPLLSDRVGCRVWVKHENHTPIGAFKLRGGIVYMHELRRREPAAAGVITATRGNHGQSIAYAANRAGLASTIVVPRGNSREKNAAMRAFGADIIEHGRDFQEALERADALALERSLHFVPALHPLLVLGVGSYSLELLTAVPQLDVVYVPIGMGSGICGMITARDALGRAFEIVGVCAENAPAYALSFEQGHAVATDSADTFADGIACRVPNPDAVELINRNVARVLTVSDEEIRHAMRALYSDTHNLAEGAGAAALAALIKERDRMRGKTVGIVLSGGNIDRELYQAILAAA
jgi:threonine dehydratase